MAPRRPDEKTIWKPDLVRMVARRTKIPEKWVKPVLDALIDIIKEEMLKGNRVVIWKFGTFHLVERAPITMKTPSLRGVRIPRRKVPAVTFAKSFRDEVIRRYTEEES